MKTQIVSILAGVALITSVSVLADTVDTDKATNTQAQATATQEVPTVLYEVSQPEVLPMQKPEMEKTAGLGPMKNSTMLPFGY